ncbi:MAG: hypothetical protein J7L26_01285 [Candidatus Aminicenantes bacterium]|nr:hypothetical protein [Candidatus Aminicenantes bacterium]
MFDNFRQEKKTLPLLFIQIGLFLVILTMSAFLVGVGIYGVTYFWNQLSTKQKKEQAELQRRQQLLREMIELKITRAGYLVKQSGGETLYVPTLDLDITNVGDTPIHELLVSVSFKLNQRVFCHCQIPILSLLPQQNVSVVANCVEWVGFGSLYKGLPLIQTSQQVTYGIWLTYQEIQVKYLEEPLVFQIFRPQLNIK